MVMNFCFQFLSNLGQEIVTKVPIMEKNHQFQEIVIDRDREIDATDRGQEVADETEIDRDRDLEADVIEVMNEVDDIVVRVRKNVHDQMTMQIKKRIKRDLSRPKNEKNRMKM